MSKDMHCRCDGGRCVSCHFEKALPLRPSLPLPAPPARLARKAHVRGCKAKEGSCRERRTEGRQGSEFQKQACQVGMNASIESLQSINQARAVAHRPTDRPTDLPPRRRMLVSRARYITKIRAVPPVACSRARRVRAWLPGLKEAKVRHRHSHENRRQKISVETEASP